MTALRPRANPFFAALGVVAACHGGEAPAPTASAAPASSAPVSSSARLADASDGDAGDAGDGGDAGSPPRSSDVLVLVDEPRVVAVEHGAIVVKRLRSQAGGLVLAPAPRDAQRSTKITAFLGRASLLDVTIATSSEATWHYARRETHYVIDMSAESDAVACVFPGAEQSGGEYSAQSTAIAIRETGAKPLAFEVVRTTTSSSSQPGGRRPKSGAPRREVARFALGASSCAARK